MKKVLIALVFTFSFQSFAGIFIDPYLTFMDKTEIDDSAKSEVRGTTFGLRLAYNNPLYYVGAEYEKSLEAEWISSSVHREVKSANMSFLFGYRPIPILKTWFKYYFSSKSNLEGGLELGGKGIGIGVGIDVRPNTTVFAEFKNIKYDICDPESSCDSGELNHKGVVFGVGFPIIL